MWAVLVIVMALAVVFVWWRRRARRVYVIDHVKLEMHPPCVIEDRVVEQVWRAAISMSNMSRRPRPHPLLVDRARVRAGRYVYLADVYLEVNARELNPREVALAWIEFSLPGDLAADRVHVEILADERHRRALRWAPRSAAGVRGRAAVS